MMPNRALSEVISQLDSEPLTHLMLGHRELFHSNLLAWFFDNLPREADDVLLPLTRTGADRDIKRKCTREGKNLDLYFEWPGYEPLVIENKVFSLPDEKQLHNYSEKISSSGTAAALLSMTNPVWPPNDRKVINGHEWRWISYRELAARIRSALPTRDNSYSVETMRRYANVVDLLCDLIEKAAVTTSGETVELPAEIKSALKDKRLRSSIAKYRSRSVARHVTEALSKSKIDQSIVGDGISHGQPLVQWFNREDTSGWQVQSSQFRLAIIVSKEIPVDGRETFAKNKERLFDFSYLDKILGTQNQPVLPRPEPGRTFRKFDNFLYRYKKVPDLTVAQLEEAAVAVARRQI